MTLLKASPLGKKITYVDQYQPDLLFPIPRKTNRENIGIKSAILPFHGYDIWNAFEISWLNERGKPIVAVAEFVFPCASSNLIESKSFKLYLNSFNNTKFANEEIVKQTLIKDLSKAAQADVDVILLPINKLQTKINLQFDGICLDDLDVDCEIYQPHPNFLTTENEIVTETLFSDLLKSNCLVTGQPDWASLQISYTGQKINHKNLLKYIISFRNHEEFHEQCVERIFVDISKHCEPEKLLVYARYTRRGGLDINPYRANYTISLNNLRLWRQ